jgi:hypothetical protein
MSSRTRVVPAWRAISAVVGAVIVLGALVAGCDSGGITVGSSGDSTTDSNVPQSTAATTSGESGSGSVEGARLLYFDKLPIAAADYPGTGAPFAARLDSVREFAATYAGTPGIEAVLGAVEQQATSDDELFVFLMQPCVADDVSLVLRGDTVTAKVTSPGGAVVRCEPPPIRMAVFAVPAGGIDDSVRPVAPSS